MQPGASEKTVNSGPNSTQLRGGEEAGDLSMRRYPVPSQCQCSNFQGNFQVETTKSMQFIMSSTTNKTDS